MTSRISLPGAKYSDPARTWDFYRRLLESLNGSPRIEAVAVGLTSPFGPGVRATARVRDRARASFAAEAPITAVEQVVSGDDLEPGEMEDLRLLFEEEPGAT